MSFLLPTGELFLFVLDVLWDFLLDQLPLPQVGNLGFSVFFSQEGWSELSAWEYLQSSGAADDLLLTRSLPKLDSDESRYGILLSNIPASLALGLLDSVSPVVLFFSGCADVFNLPQPFGQMSPSHTTQSLKGICLKVFYFVGHTSPLPTTYFSHTINYFCQKSNVSRIRSATAH